MGMILHEGFSLEIIIQTKKILNDAGAEWTVEQHRWG